MNDLEVIKILLESGMEAKNVIALFPPTSEKSSSATPVPPPVESAPESLLEQPDFTKIMNQLSGEIAQLKNEILNQNLLHSKIETSPEPTPESVLAKMFAPPMKGDN